MNHWQRATVVSLTLATFVIANCLAVSHASQAAFADRSPNSVRTSVAESSQDHYPTANCKHGCCKHRQSLPKASAAVTDLRDSPPRPSCPDQDTGSSCPDCPFPGGCSLCSVAKVPCFSMIPSITVPTPCLEQYLAESALLLPPDHCGRLIRPPRA